MLRRAFPAVLAVSMLVSGCNFTQAGSDPAPRVLNYPIAAELYQPDPTMPAQHLVVANSNFDLAYNTGSVQAFDVGAALDAEITAQCGGVQGADCVIEDLSNVIVGEVGISSHSDGMAFSTDQRRLYLPVRTGRDLTWIDFDPAGERVLSCRQEYRNEDADPSADIPRCSDQHQISRREDIANERELNLLGDPVDVAVIPSSDVGSTVGEFVLMLLRDGRVALFLDRPPGVVGRAAGPELIHVASGFPANLVTITVQPNTGIAWMTAVGTDFIARVGLIVDEVNPARSFLYDAGSLRLGGVDDGEDTRDFQFHPDPARTDTAFVLSRRPESVVEVDLQRRGLTAIDLGLRDVYEVGAGPSRLLPIVVDGRTYVLASCFGAQRLFVIDIDHGALVSVVGGFSGPFEIVVDSVADRLYVVDFIVSAIRVVDLSPLRTGGQPVLMATIGKPNPPRTLID